MKNTKSLVSTVVLAVMLLAVITVTVSAQEATDVLVPIFSGETLARVAIAIFLASVAEFLVDGLISPLFDKFKWDSFWLRYIAWGVASGIVALGGVNLFSGYITNMLIGQVLTAIFCGGGSNKVHDFFDKYLSSGGK